jgi:hypothetical protein
LACAVVQITCHPAAFVILHLQKPFGEFFQRGCAFQQLQFKL